MIHFLCKAGNDVTVIARSTYDELKNNGLVIRHHLQKKTTVDHPRVLKEDDGSHYDIVFSVMQGQQQVAFLPVTDLTLGGLYEPAPDADVSLVKAALNTKGYKVTPVDCMYAYYMYHVAEVMPYCYHVGCNLKKASRTHIKMIMSATKEYSVRRIESDLKAAGYSKDMKVIVYPHGSHLNGLMPNREREKKLYRMIPLIGFMYKTFGKYRKENISYFEQSEKEIIEWIV